MTVALDPAPRQTAPPSHAGGDVVIATHGLGKSYGSRAAVRDLDLAVPRGVVAGFVGPNGAGKTTTIRMLLGLVRPSAGTASVLGHPITRPHDYLPRVGALIESPAFYPSLNGRDNLRLLATLGGITHQGIPSLLDTVGLAGRERDRVGGYSLGMKQRLGIAAALLPNPDVLILDEPANGLDPPGIIEMRSLMRRLRDDGKTIFVSSHLLGEVEQVADWVIVLNNGQSVFAGPTGDILKASHGGIVVVPERADQYETVARIAESDGHTVTPHAGSLHIGAPREYTAQLNRQTMQAGVTLVEIRASQATLEESFLAIISANDSNRSQS